MNSIGIDHDFLKRPEFMKRKISVETSVISYLTARRFAQSRRWRDAVGGARTPRRMGFPP